MLHSCCTHTIYANTIYYRMSHKWSADIVKENEVWKIQCMHTGKTYTWYAKTMNNDNEHAIMQRLSESSPSTEEESAYQLSDNVWMPSFLRVYARDVRSGSEIQMPGVQDFRIALNKLIDFHQNDLNILVTKSLTDDGYILFENSTLTEDEYTQIAKSLFNFSRRQGIMHGDLKSNNLLVNEKDKTQLCLIDFELSVHYTDSPNWDKYIMSNFWQLKKSIAKEARLPTQRLRFGICFDMLRLMSDSKNNLQEKHMLPPNIEKALLPTQIEFTDNNGELLNEEWFSNFCSSLAQIVN